MLCLSNYEHLNRAELTKIDIQIEVLEDSSDGGLQVRIDLLILKPRYGYAANSWQINLAIAIDNNAGVEIDLSPGANQELVARTDYVVRRHRDAVHRRECAGHIFEEIASVNGKTLAGRAVHEF